jgi:hypothetical protein
MRDRGEREWALATLDRQAGRLRGADRPGEIYRGKEREQIIENMASALGIDTTDPGDEIAQLVRLGIKDMDPSRILRNCEHLFITLGARGLVADWLGLQTMGEKIIHCPLHNFSTPGWSLDGTYDHFRRQYCDECPDATPRAPGWEHNDEFQQAENETYREYMEKYEELTRRPLPPCPLAPDIERQMKTEDEAPSE